MEEHRFDPWSRKIPNPQLSPCTTATEPGLQSPGGLTTELMPCNKRSHHNEKPACSLQLEKSPHNNEDLAQPKINVIFKKKLFKKSKYIINKVKGQREIIFTWIKLEKDYYPEHIKNSYKLMRKIQPNFLKKRRIDASQKRKSNVQYGKLFNLISRACKVKPQWNTIN